MFQLYDYKLRTGGSNDSYIHCWTPITGEPLHFYTSLRYTRSHKVEAFTRVLEGFDMGRASDPDPSAALNRIQGPYSASRGAKDAVPSCLRIDKAIPLSPSLTPRLRVTLPSSTIHNPHNNSPKSGNSIADKQRWSALTPSASRTQTSAPLKIARA